MSLSFWNSCVHGVDVFQSGWTIGWKQLRRDLRLSKRRRLVSFKANICFNPCVRIWANTTGLSMNGHEDIMWLKCKQTQQYAPELSIEDFCEVGNAYDCFFRILIVKRALECSLLCELESDDESLTLRMRTRYISISSIACVDCSSCHRRGVPVGSFQLGEVEASRDIERVFSSKTIY